MATKQVNTVEEGDEYYHVRFRDPDNFSEIRTPDWAEEAANSVSQNAEVRTGKLEGQDDWLVQSVLIQKEAGKDKAVEQAQKIVDKIEDGD